MITPAAAHRALTEHPHFHYRGCAPDVDEPSRAAGDLDVSIDAWSASTEDGGETQKARIAREKAAVRVCQACPVLAVCRTYATSYTLDPAGSPRLAEPEGVLGGLRALERHRLLIASRTAEPAGTIPARALREASTPQKRALLRALASSTDEELIAYRAGMDVRTANWQRSQLCTLLGLDKETATRDQLLDAARTHGLLAPSIRVRPDGPWPYAAAPTTDGARQRRIAPGMPIQLAIPGLPAFPRGRRPRPTPPEGAPHRVRRAHRLRIVPTPPVQLTAPTVALGAAA